MHYNNHTLKYLFHFCDSKFKCSSQVKKKKDQNSHFVKLNFRKILQVKIDIYILSFYYDFQVFENIIICFCYFNTKIHS